MSEKRNIDWDLIEVDYRAGMKPLRLIAEEHGITHGAVNKRAKAKGWTRDLATKIAQRAEEKVSKAAVSAQVSTVSKATETQVIEANAELQKQIRLEHRTDIARSRQLFRSLMEELEVSTSREGQALLELMGDVLKEKQDDESDIGHDARVGRISRLMSKLLDGPARIDSAKKLVEMLEKVVRLEREAFGIKSEDKADGVYETLLRNVMASDGQG